MPAFKASCKTILPLRSWGLVSSELPRWKAFYFKTVAGAEIDLVLSN
jgi:hypothetical protein